jgi:hypothetical protein
LFVLLAGLLVTKNEGSRLLKSGCLLCFFQKLPEVFAATQLGSKFLAMIVKNEWYLLWVGEALKNLYFWLHYFGVCSRLTAWNILIKVKHVSFRAKFIPIP